MKTKRSSLRRVRAAVKKDLRTPKYRMRVEQPLKGKASFRRNRKEASWE